MNLLPFTPPKKNVTEIICPLNSVKIAPTYSLCIEIASTNSLCIISLCEKTLTLLEAQLILELN